LWVYSYPKTRKKRKVGLKAGLADPCLLRYTKSSSSQPLLSSIKYQTHLERSLIPCRGVADTVCRFGYGIVGRCIDIVDRAVSKRLENRKDGVRGHFGQSTVCLLVKGLCLVGNFDQHDSGVV